MKYYCAHSKKDVVGKRERERERERKKKGGKKGGKMSPYLFFCVALNFTQQHQQGKKRERFLLSGIGGLALFKSE